MIDRKSIEDFIAAEFGDDNHKEKYRHWYGIPYDQEDSPVQGTDFDIDVPRRLLSVDALFRTTGTVNATEIAGIARGHLLLKTATIYRVYRRGKPLQQTWSLSFSLIRGREWSHPDFTQPIYAELRNVESRSRSGAVA